MGAPQFDGRASVDFQKQAVVLFSVVHILKERGSKHSSWRAVGILALTELPKSQEAEWVYTLVEHRGFFLFFSEIVIGKGASQPSCFPRGNWRFGEAYICKRLFQLVCLHSRVCQPWRSSHGGLKNSLLGWGGGCLMHDGVLTAIQGFYPPEAVSTCSHCDKPKCPQTLPNVPWVGVAWSEMAPGWEPRLFYMLLHGPQ